jgi:hypothetical protein
MLSNRIGRDTVSLSNRIDLLASNTGAATTAKLNISDTSAMLSNRFARDTASLSTRITTNKQAIIDTASALRSYTNLKVNISDTSAMLSNRFARDTVSLSNRINANNQGIIDTASALRSYANLKLNISDTSAMLSNRIGRDTVSLSNRIDLLTSNTGAATTAKLNISDTSAMLSNRFARDTASLSNRINLKLTITDSSSLNLPNTIVARDGLGNFSIGTINGALNGNASTASALQIARSIYGNNFDGTAAVTGVISPAFGGTGVNNADKTLTLNGNLVTIGNFNTALSTTGTTNLTLPTSGTLSTLDGAETLTNKTLVSPILTSPNLGTPTAVVLSNATGLPLSTGVVGILPPSYGGTGVDNGSNTLRLGGMLTTIGADSLTFNISGKTNLNLPTSGKLITAESNDTISGIKIFNDQKIAVLGSSTGKISFSSSNATSSDYILTLPSITATIATLSGTEILTNKTISSPVITSPTGIVKSDVGLGNVDNTNDVDKPISILQQAAFDLREALANKSTNVIADSASNIKYPSVKAIKKYVDDQVAATTINDASATTKGIIKLAGDLAGTGSTADAPLISDAAITSVKLANEAVTNAKIFDGAITSSKLADGAVTNAKITSVSASKITGVLSSSNGGAGTLNGVLQADGNGNVSVATAGTDYATPSQVASSYLPLIGGTLTGALNGTTANFSGALTAGGITFPTSDGTAGQLLVTNGSGTLTWSSGALSIGSIAGSSNSKGAVLSSNVLSLTPADSSNGGIVTIAAQTFAGAKTFSSAVTITDAIDATSTSTGALIVAGGASIAKNLFVGGLTASSAVFTDANKGLTTSGTLGITQGGTGAITALAGFNTLSPMTTAGDLIYGGTSGSGTRLGIGAANSVLRSNGSAPIWGAVTLTTDVTGILPLVNGGTGSSTQNFVDLTTAQTIAGNKTLSGATIFNGNVTISGTNVLSAGGTNFPTATGTIGQVLTLSSAGVASWGSAGTAVRDVTDQFTTVTGTTPTQTFTLTQTPHANSKVKMFINGIRINNSAYSFSGTTVTYTVATNGSYQIVAGDRVQFDYFY